MQRQHVRQRAELFIGLAWSTGLAMPDFQKYKQLVLLAIYAVTTDAALAIATAVTRRRSVRASQPLPKIGKAGNAW